MVSPSPIDSERGSPEFGRSWTCREEIDITKRDGSLVPELPQQSTLTTEVAEDRWAQVREEEKRKRGRDSKKPR